MKRILILFFLLPIISFAQTGIGIGTTTPEATLDVRENDPTNPTASAGIAIPQVHVLPVSGNRSGQLVLLTTDNKLYYYNGSAWGLIESVTTHTGDVTGDTALTIGNAKVTTSKIADDAVTIDKIGTDGATDANKALETNASGDPVWAIKTTYTTIHTFGDIKSGIQATDHNGWVKLNGRLLNTLTTSQQTAAADLGLTDNLPNASNAYLSQDGGTLGASSGSNTTTIARNQLPNFTLSGSTTNNGAHTHNFQRPKGDQNYANGNSPETWWGYNKNLTETTASAGDHNHSYTTPSINGNVTQQSLSLKPLTLSVNMFIYLGM